jgi:hypothetical protein
MTHNYLNYLVYLSPLVGRRSSRSSRSYAQVPIYLNALMSPCRREGALAAGIVGNLPESEEPMTKAPYINNYLFLSLPTPSEGDSPFGRDSKGQRNRHGGTTSPSMKYRSQKSTPFPPRCSGRELPDLLIANQTLGAILLRGIAIPPAICATPVPPAGRVTSVELRGVACLFNDLTQGRSNHA